MLVHVRQADAILDQTVQNVAHMLHIGNVVRIERSYSHLWDARLIIHRQLVESAPHALIEVVRLLVTFGKYLNEFLLLG